METLCHSHCYPSIPDSPDSSSPIPDEYAYPHKGDGVGKRAIPLKARSGFGGVFPIYNVPMLHLHPTNSQLQDRSYQPTINRDTPARQPNTPISEQQGTITNRRLEPEKQRPQDSSASQSRPIPQTPTHKLSSFGRSARQVSEYNTACTPRTQYIRSSSKQNMTSSPESRSQSSSNSSTKPSVKHLTCWWWYEKGQCRYNDSECLYAHHDTGLVADAPRQIKPGEPALAGRSLDRALRQVQQESSHEKGSEVEESQYSAGEKTTIEEENRLLCNAYETLFAAASHSLEATTQFRRAFSKYSHELQSQEKAASAATTNVADAAHTRAIDAANTDSYSNVAGGMATSGARPRLGNMVSIQELASSMREIEQKSLESGAAEWNTRAKISSIESMLGEASMEDLVQSARKLARR